MVAPLTERLRDIEATTRFTNDFMSAVGDMNVMTGEMHMESNFSQFLQVIAGRIQHVEQEFDQVDGSRSSNPGREKGNKREAGMKDDRKIDTDGGCFHWWSVNTGGGDFTGRDKNTSISIGGNVSGSNIVVGNHNKITTNTQNVFTSVYHAIEQSKLPVQDKIDIQVEVKEIEAEIVKADHDVEILLVFG